MKKRAFTEAVFLTSVLAIIAVVVIMQFMGNEKDSDSAQVSQNSTSAYHESILPSLNTNKSSVNAIKAAQASDKYAMPEPFAAANNLFGFSYPISKSMDPNTWMQMMMNMMNPHGTSAQDMCASCHQGDDLARYQQQFGPFLDASWNQYKAMMDPHAFGAMMNPNLMTQMMHQMMTIPTQMMMPFMSGNFGMTSHPMGPSNSSGSFPNLMSPEEYKNWYDEQQDKRGNNK